MLVRSAQGAARPAAVSASPRSDAVRGMQLTSSWRVAGCAPPGNSRLAPGQGLVWLLRTTSARGQLIPMSWIDHPYAEEDITLLEEELLPAMEAFLLRVGEIDAALEADQEAAVQELAAAGRR